MVRLSGEVTSHQRRPFMVRKYVYPKVALTNDNTVVEVHKGQFLEKCFYRIGKVNIESKEISWSKSKFFNSPDVAVSEDSTVVAVFQDNMLTKQLNYRVGRINDSTDAITWIGRRKRHIYLKHYNFLLTSTTTVMRL